MRSIACRGLFSVGLALVGSCFDLASTTHAQEISSDSKLEEVVVTSRKRVESVLDVPISIDTVTAAEIEDLDLKDMTDIAKMTPGMFYTNFEANRADRLGASYVVRGISLNSYNNFSDAALLFVDGAPVVSGNLPSIDDIERVEVLKGPQAAYFGRNTFAGAISVTTREPSDTWEARAMAEASSYHSSDVSLSVEGPVIPDTVLMRFTTEAHTQGGEYHNWLNTNDTLGGQTTDSFGLTLKITPAVEGLVIRLGADYYTYDDEPGAQARLIDNSLNCDPGHTGRNTWYCGAAPHVQPNQINYDFTITPQYRAEVFPTSIFGGNGIDDHAGVQSNNWHLNAKINYALPYGIDLETITAWDRTEAATISDEWYDPNFYDFFNPAQPWNWLYLVEEYKADFSQEFRLTSAKSERLRWTVGGNYLNLKANAGHVAGITPLANPANYPGNIGGSTTYAGFGGLYYDLLAPLELGLEARYQADDVYNDTNGGAPLKGTFNSFSPRVTLKYKISPETSVYALYAKGTRPGAFNATLAPGYEPGLVTAAAQAAIVAQTGASVNVKEEQIQNYEIGLKTEFLNGRGFATLDGYYGKITNQQIQDAFTVLETVGNETQPYVGDVLVNRGETRLDGIEAEIDFQVSQGLRVSAAFALNNTDILSGPDTSVAALRGCNPAVPSCDNVDGNHLPNAPRTQGNVQAQYTRPLNAQIKWYVSGEYIYVGTKYAETANLLQTGAQELLNARIGLTGERWKAEIWGKNITNNRTPELVSDAFDYNTFVTNAVEIALPQKPTFGLRANYRF